MSTHLQNYESNLSKLHRAQENNPRYVQSIIDPYIDCGPKNQYFDFLGFSIRPTEECIINSTNRWGHFGEVLTSNPLMRFRKECRASELEGCLRYSEISLPDLLPLDRHVIAIVATREITLDKEGNESLERINRATANFLRSLQVTFQKTQAIETPGDSLDLGFAKRKRIEEIQWLARDAYDLRARICTALYSNRISRPTEMYDNRYNDSQFVNHCAYQHQELYHSLKYRIELLLQGKLCKPEDEWPPFL